MMKWLVSDGYRTDNPTTGLIILNFLKLFLEFVGDRNIFYFRAAEKLSPPDNLRMSAGIEILYGAGLRISELLQVRRADIIFIKKFDFGSW